MSRVVTDNSVILRPAAAAAPPVEWVIEPGLVAYPDALEEMAERARAIADGRAAERVWLVEHPPLYTAGTSANMEDVVDAGELPVYRSGRGGQLTYHGPGQRVVYLMLDLGRRRRDVRAYVGALEQWLIDTLAGFGVVGERREDRVGVWVRRAEGSGEDKIAAIGIRVSRWVTSHGIALNVAPDLDHFSGIVPCGIREHGVTSLAALGKARSLWEADSALLSAFEPIFGSAKPPVL
jgi:lipoyl(octanoyl) transferase